MVPAYRFLPTDWSSTYHLNWCKIEQFVLELLKRRLFVKHLRIKIWHFSHKVTIIVLLSKMLPVRIFNICLKAERDDGAEESRTQTAFYIYERATWLQIPSIWERLKLSVSRVSFHGENHAPFSCLHIYLAPQVTVAMLRWIINNLSQLIT